MAITFTDGTITTSTSEDTINDITGDAIYAFWLFAHNMTASETFVVNIYAKDQNGGTMRLYLTETLTGVQSSPAFYLAPLVTKQFKVTIQKTAGTNRAVTWQRAEIT